MKKLALIATAVPMVAIPSAVSAAETTQPVQAAAEEVAAPVEVNRGMMLYGANGNRIANVYRVTADGNPQVIIDGRLITVPVETLSEKDGKVMTSLTKREVARTR